MLLAFCWYLNVPQKSRTFSGTPLQVVSRLRSLLRALLLPRNLLNKKSKIIINQFIEVTICDFIKGLYFNSIVIQASEK